MTTSDKHSVPPPPNNLGLALLAVLLFLPLGVAAVVKSAQVPRLWSAGRHTEALQAAAGAKKRAVWAIVIFVVVVVVILALRIAPNFR